MIVPAWLFVMIGNPRWFHAGYPKCFDGALPKSVSFGLRTSRNS